MLLEESDAVVAAETGCGKTMCYLAPLLSQMLRRREQFPCEPLDESPIAMRASK